ncbi:MAG: tetratricopeptide repeat protein [Bacteroidetes bacterium]|nr:tetratricopeptide repeat protein [Bacteroidota bacterium]
MAVMIKTGKLLLLFFLLLVNKANAQQLNNSIDSLIKRTVKDLGEEKNDSIRVRLMGKLSYSYQYVDFKKSFLYADSALRLAKKIDYKIGIAKSYNFLGLTYATIGKLDLALINYLAALKENEKSGIEAETAKNLNNIGETLIKIGDDTTGIKYINRAYRVNKKYNNKNSMAISLSLMSEVYLYRADYKNALSHLYEAKKTSNHTVGAFDDGYFYNKLGKIYLKQGNLDSAFYSFKKVLNIEDTEPDQKINTLFGLSEIAIARSDFNESEKLLEQALEIAKKSNARLELIRVYKGLSDVAYQKNELKNSISYLNKSTSLKDSLLGFQTSGQILNSLNKIINEQKDSENDQLRLESEIKQSELSKQNTILIILVIGITISITLAIIAMFSFRSRNRAYTKLNIANEIIQKQNQNLEQSIEKRTATILEKNKKLKDLAYFNSHNVRKHLANILGLIFLIKEEGNNKEYLNLMESESKSLDETIKEINKMIHQ